MNDAEKLRIIKLFKGGESITTLGWILRNRICIRGDIETIIRDYMNGKIKVARKRK